MGNEKSVRSNAAGAYPVIDTRNGGHLTLLRFSSFSLHFFCFLRPHLRHMDVPGLGVGLELPAYTTATATPEPCYDLRLTHGSERGQVSNLRPHGYQSGSLPLRHNGNSAVFSIFNFFFFWPNLWHAEAPRPGSNPQPSSNQSHSRDNTRSLTC